MADLRLGKIPDRIPLKITLHILPDLHEALQSYALLYNQTYGQEAAIVEIIPAMLAQFMQSDRMFMQTCSVGKKG